MANDIAPPFRSASKGNSAAQYALALMYFLGSNGLSRSNAQGLAWLKKAAAVNHGKADDVLNRIISKLPEDGADIEGIIIKVPDKELLSACAEFEDSLLNIDALTQGSAITPEGQHDYGLGVKYEIRAKTRNQFKQAAQFYRKAALKGHAKALSSQQRLEKFLLDFVEPVHEKPKIVLAPDRTMVEANNNEAIKDYELGLGCERRAKTKNELKQALQFYRKAALKGHAQALVSQKELEAILLHFVENGELGKNEINPSHERIRTTTTLPDDSRDNRVAFAKEAFRKKKQEIERLAADDNIRMENRKKSEDNLAKEAFRKKKQEIDRLAEEEIDNSLVDKKLKEEKRLKAKEDFFLSKKLERQSLKLEKENESEEDAAWEAEMEAERKARREAQREMERDKEIAIALRMQIEVDKEKGNTAVYQLLLFSVVFTMILSTCSDKSYVDEDGSILVNSNRTILANSSQTH